MYLNDDYEGGELWFPYLDLTFKAEAGDIVLFPSTYIFAHAAKPVISGTKYSAVTMFDYNDRNHDVKSSVQEQYAKVQSS
jgi:predicted 2-oxoglutarate/Fe(II)-dependent dioxygenase YbiX